MACRIHSLCTTTSGSWRQGIDPPGLLHPRTLQLTPPGQPFMYEGGVHTLGSSLLINSSGPFRSPYLSGHNQPKRSSPCLLPILFPQLSLCSPHFILTPHLSTCSSFFFSVLLTPIYFPSFLGIFPIFLRSNMDHRRHCSRSISPHSLSLSHDRVDASKSPNDGLHHACAHANDMAINSAFNHTIPSPNPVPLVSYPSLSPLPCSVNPMPSVSHINPLPSSSHTIDPLSLALHSSPTQLNLTTFGITSSLDISNFINPPWSDDKLVPHQPHSSDNSDLDSITSLDLNSIDGLIHPITGKMAKTDLDNPYRFLEWVHTSLFLARHLSRYLFQWHHRRYTLLPFCPLLS